jgi:hypothetical protein
MRLLTLVILTALAGSIVYLWHYTDHLYILETTSPRLEDAHIPPMTGKNAGNIHITVHDDKSGIKEFSLYLTQGDSQLQLEKIYYADPVPSHISKPEFEGLHSHLKEGPAVVTLIVKDASIWGNMLKKEFDITLDFKSPTLSVLSRQHLSVQGGSEFILIEAKDTHLEETGIIIEPYRFNAIPAHIIDPGFKIPIFMQSFLHFHSRYISRNL